mmetsp:Transcript_5057/g.8283  ORF Transcript_5057/g.8283 Transcript_5057/m.8283 type:complete len:150 (-) Transcript_5057:341-790(-)
MRKMYHYLSTTLYTNTTSQGAGWMPPGLARDGSRLRNTLSDTAARLLFLRVVLLGHDSSADFLDEGDVHEKGRDHTDQRTNHVDEREVKTLDIRSRQQEQCVIDCKANWHVHGIDENQWHVELPTANNGHGESNSRKDCQYDVDSEQVI